MKLPFRIHHIGWRFLTQLPPYLKTPILLSLLVSSMIALSLLVFYFSLQPQVPMFYSLAVPNEYLVSKMWLLVFPLFSFGVYLLHWVILQSLTGYDKSMKQLFAWFTFVIEFLIGLAFLRIMLLVV